MDQSGQIDRTKPSPESSRHVASGALVGIASRTHRSPPPLSLSLVPLCLSPAHIDPLRLCLSSSRIDLSGAATTHRPLLWRRQHAASTAPPRDYSTQLTHSPKRRGMESGGAQAVASSKAPQSRVTFGDETSIEEKTRKIESGSAQAVASAAPQSRVPLGDDGRPLDGVMRAKLLRNLKHSDGSIFRSNGYWAKVYRLHDTNETCLEPMMMTEPLTSCMPDWMVCQRHDFRTMMQIFSLKLAYTSSYVGGPVQLYGYVAVRDLLNPMRNYIFNRTRDDPFVVEHDGFIRMTGPKRGIRMEAPVLIEFNMKIKRGEVKDDLQLIDCVASFNDITSRHATANRRRIDGDCGAVDITYALVHSAAEATVQVGISEMVQGDGFRLDAAAFYTGLSLDLNERIQLFDGIVSAEASELSRTVVAVVKVDQLLVSLILSQASGSDHRVLRHSCTFPVQKHGNRISVFKLGLATIEVKVTWSTLDIPQSLFGPNCFECEFMAAEDVEYEGD